MQKRLAWLINNGYTDEEGSVTRTRTTTFLMPLIGISEQSVMDFHPKIFINAYVDNFVDKKIILVLNKLDFEEESKDFIVTEHLNEHFERCDENEEEYLLYYNIPEHFYDDFMKIIQGQYSKTSSSYKEILIKIYGNERNTIDYKPMVFDCLFPTDEKRQQYADFLGVEVILIDEVSSRPRREYEIFKSIEQLKEIL
jgi:hypothetical protein